MLKDVDLDDEEVEIFCYSIDIVEDALYSLEVFPSRPLEWSLFPKTTGTSHIFAPPKAQKEQRFKIYPRRFCIKSVNHMNTKQKADGSKLF